MNAPVRMSTTSEGRAAKALGVLEEIVQLATGPDPVLSALRRVLVILAECGLTEGCVAAVTTGGRLSPLVFLGSQPPRCALPDAVRQRLSTEAVVRLDAIDQHRPLLGTLIRCKGETVGLLTAVAADDASEDRAALLGLVANLFGSLVALAGHAARTATAPASVPASARIVGASRPLQSVLDQALRFAPHKLAVLLRGESGSGKALFAHLIHEHSPRAGRPFVTLNCPALDDDLLESVLFGHEKGAFTGAQAERRGHFEFADGGTLFLDEIADLRPAFQAKLLRVLQQGEFERIGGTETIKVDVRVIASTQHNLEAAVAEGRFRADLYHRVAGAPIFLPALRDRREDIPALAEHLLARFNAENCCALSLAASATAMVSKCLFPGNVRELENCLRAAAVAARGPEILKRDLGCRNGVCFASRLRRARSSLAREHTLVGQES